MRISLVKAYGPAGLWQPWWLAVAALALGLVLAQLPLPLAGGLVVGGAALLMILIQPLAGLALALLAGPLGALENIALGRGPLDSGQLLLLLTLAAWLGRGLVRRRIFLPRTWLNLPLAVFIGVAAVSLLGAPSLLFGFFELLKWLEMSLVMVMVVDVTGDRGAGGRGAAHTCAQGQGSGAYMRRGAGEAWLLLGMILAAGLGQALIGVWQFGLRGDGPEHFVILGRFYRAYGTFEQPNPYGGYVGLNAALALGVLAGGVMGYWRGRKEGNAGRAMTWVWWAFVALCAVAMTLAVVFSWSRGAWLGFAVALVVLALFLPRRRRLGVALVGVAAGLFLAGNALGLVPASVAGRLNSFSQDLRFGDVRGVDINDANYAVLERLAHWQAAVDMARDDVWLGVGFGNYEPAYADYALINWPYALGHAHNYYLNILAESGVLGAAAYFLFWAAVFWQTIHLLGRLAWPQRGLALGLLAAWTALSVHHLVDKLYVNNVYVHLGAMFGLLQLLERRHG